MNWKPLKRGQDLSGLEERLNGDRKIVFNFIPAIGRCYAVVKVEKPSYRRKKVKIIY